MSFEESCQLIESYESSPTRLARQLMIGVLASSKTLFGGTNKYPGRYPNVDDIWTIFPSSTSALNMIHYATDDQDTLVRQLQYLVGVGGKRLHGFQLNMAWPDIEKLELFHRITDKKYRIILQVGSRALEIAGSTLRDRLRQYAESETIDDVLIDCSGGKGIPLDTNSCLRLLEQLYRRIGSVNIGVAGGLGPHSMQLLVPILKEFPWISWDAEGALRNKADDSLNVPRTRMYVEQSCALAKKAGSP